MLIQSMQWYCISQYWGNIIAYTYILIQCQGVITYMSPVEAFATF